MEDRLLSIGMFAKISGISRKNLIFYDKEGVFPPAYVAPNGYRYYAYWQLDLLTVIITLQESGMSLQEIKDYIVSANPDAAIALFTKQSRLIHEKIERLSSIEEMLHMRLSTLKTGIAVEPGKVYREDKTAVPLFLSRQLQCMKGDLSAEAWLSFCEDFEKKSRCFGYPSGYLISNESLCSGRYCELSNLYFLLPDAKYANGAIPAGTYLTTYIHGHYDDDISAAYARLLAYASDQGLHPSGNAYEDYVLDEIADPRPNATLIRLAMQVSRAQ